MKRHHATVLLMLTAGLVISGAAQERSPSVNSSSAALTDPHRAPEADSRATHSSRPSKTPSANPTEASLRLEGEQRFRTNCGRCHQPPHKFPPRVMATAIRHMRVRAMITDEDMRLILRYMTE